MSHGVKDVVAVHSGHHQVEDDRVRVLGPRDLDRAPSIPGHEGLVALRVEGKAKDHTDDGLIIDYEDARHPTPFSLFALYRRSRTGT
jgi:hypothetical protein